VGAASSTIRGAALGRKVRLALACATGLLAACGEPPPSVIKTSSTPKVPAWMTRLPTEGGVLFFSGTQPSAASLDEGKASATDRARDEAAKYIGVSISSKLNSTISTDVGSESVKAQSEVQSRTAALIKSAQVADVYWEKNARAAGATTLESWDVSVLLKLPQSEVEAERKRQEEEAKATARAMLSRYREGRSLEGKSQALSALQRYRDAERQLQSVGRSVETGDLELKDVGALLQAASDSAKRVQAKARTGVLVGPDLGTGALTQGLSKKGFSASNRGEIDDNSALQAAKSAGIPYVIAVRTHSTPGQGAFNQVAVHVELDVRAVEVQSGAVVAQVRVSKNGFARVPEEAERKAAAEAGTSAGSELATQLLARESSAQ
jgi:hypothetical protein